jgi:branched-chain amino acid transport system permease protein
MSDGSGSGSGSGPGVRHRLGRLTGRTGARLRATVLRPAGRLLALVLWPLERLFAPLAGGFNRFLGDHFGRVTGLQFAFLLLAFGGLLTAPVWGEDLLLALTLASIWGIFAMGWDIQSGYTGYISFGHSALSGAAGYTTALLVTHVDPNMALWLTIPASILVTLVVGLLIAVPTLRLRGPYFSLITFVTVLLFFRLAKALAEWTNGLRGLRVEVFTYQVVDQYYMMLVPTLLVAVALTFVARSNVGTILVAIRENEDAVAAAGLDPTKFKLWSFVLSSVPMGIGGVLLAHFQAGVDPQTFLVVNNSIEMIAMAVIGGMSSILGALGGAVTFVLLRDEFLLGFGDQGRWLALWLLVLGVLVFARQGLFRIVWHLLGALGGDEE